LFVEKSGLLAVPNTIITAVGTKIFDRLLAFPPEDVRGWVEDDRCEPKRIVVHGA
jgi:hypothetical protein